MLSSHLGQDVFIKGVSDYLKKHAYGNHNPLLGILIPDDSCVLGNATTNDLWSALSKASNQDVNTLMVR